MSRENVELVREGVARWNEGDYDFFLNSTAPDIELLSRFGSLTEHLVAEISHVIEPKVEAFEALLYIREPLAHSPVPSVRDRKSTRLNSSHANISYAVFC